MILGVVSDAHGNAAALRRALSVLRSGDAEEIVFLGDAVGYIPSLEAFDMVESEGLPSLRGNHEDMLLGGTTPLDRDAVYGHAATANILDAARRARMAMWPTSRRFADGAVLALHGSPTDPISGYIYPDTPLEAFAPSAPIVVMGHTHRPFIRRCGGVLYVNAGSCAMPRDTGGFGAVAIIDTVAGTARLLRFDIRDTVETVAGRFALHRDVLRALRRRVEEQFEGCIVHV
jgi:predicted phosphodiesterase